MPRWAYLPLNKSAFLSGHAAAQSPRPPMPLVYASRNTSRCPRKTRGQDGFATSFPVGSCLPYHMPARRTPVYPLSAHNRRVLLERPTSANKTLWSLSSMSLRNADEREHRTIHGAGRPSDRRAWRGERGCNRQSPQRRAERCPRRQRSGDPSPKLHRAGRPSSA